MAEHVIEIRVDDKIAAVVGDPQYVCGNSDYIVKFIFDAEWTEHTAKTARFIKSNKEYVDVPFTGNQCAVPILENTPQVRIGVYAGNLRTTTPAIVNAQRSILCGSGTPVDPPDDVYNQLMVKLDNITNIKNAENAEKLGGVDASKYLLKADGLKFELLWQASSESLNSSVPFPAQNLNLGVGSLTKYKMIVVVLRTYYQWTTTIFLTPECTSTRGLTNNKSSLIHRNISSNLAGGILNFQSVYVNGTEDTSYDAYLKPQAIYGL